MPHVVQPKTKEEMLQCAERELAMRKRVYSRKVNDGTMTAEWPRTSTIAWPRSRNG